VINDVPFNLDPPHKSPASLHDNGTAGARGIQRKPIVNVQQLVQNYKIWLGITIKYRKSIYYFTQNVAALLNQLLTNIYDDHGTAPKTAVPRNLKKP